jgi:hypothetical protein
MMSKTVTKTEVQAWIRRVREDLRDIEAALKTNDWAGVVEASLDASGAATEITTMAEVRTGMVDVTGTYV